MIINAGPNTLNAALVSTAIQMGTLSGIVRNAVTNAAIPGVTVTCGSTTVTTDNTGAYAITEIPPGTYVVTFSKPGYNTLTY